MMRGGLEPGALNFLISLAVGIVLGDQGAPHLVRP